MPIARSVDVDGTRRLLEASQRARVAHFIHVSIAGLEDSPLPYSRVKLTGEKLVRQSAVPWSIVRATPFYYLVARLLHSVRWLPLWPLPDAPFHPVDTGDVATYLIACLDDDERGIREEIGGPEVLSFVEVARQYQQASGVHRVIVPLHISPKTARRMGFAEACGRRGTKTWSSWLREHTLAAEPRPTTAPGRR